MVVHLEEMESRQIEQDALMGRDLGVDHTPVFFHLHFVNTQPCLSANLVVERSKRLPHSLLCVEFDGCRSVRVLVRVTVWATA